MGGHCNCFHHFLLISFTHEERVGKKEREGGERERARERELQQQKYPAWVKTFCTILFHNTFRTQTTHPGSVVGVGAELLGELSR